MTNHPESRLVPRDITITCSICRKVERPGDYIHGAQLLAQKLCFDCDFWQSAISKANDRASIRIDATLYWVGSPKATGVKGYGGSKFVIRMLSGETFTTSNLWCQGTIPERFRGLLPDNAEFAKLDNAEFVRLDI